MFQIKFDVVEMVETATNKPSMVSTREGDATAEEILKMLNDPRIVKLTAKRKSYKWGKPYFGK